MRRNRAALRRKPLPEGMECQINASTPQNKKNEFREKQQP
jgi:hypothetical protein